MKWGTVVSCCSPLAGVFCSPLCDVLKTESCIMYLFSLTQSNALSPRWQHIYIVAMDTTSITLCQHSLTHKSKRYHSHQCQTSSASFSMNQKCIESGCRTCRDIDAAPVIKGAEWQKNQCVSIRRHRVHDVRWIISLSLGLIIWYFWTGHRSHCSSCSSSECVLLSLDPLAV